MSGSDINNSYDHGYYDTPGHVVGAGIGLSVLSIVSVWLRFAARKMQKEALKADDWFLIPATLLNLGIGITIIYGVSKKALGHSLFEIPLTATENYSLSFDIQWAYGFLLSLALGCTKLSFILFYRRIFATARWGKTNMLLVGMCILVGLWTGGFFFTFIFVCHTSRDDHCVSSFDLIVVFAITDTLLDVAIFIIPIPLIWRLNMKLDRKAAVTAIFLFGSITVAASVTRLIITSRVFIALINGANDPFLPITSLLYWGMVESGIAVFVACLPTLWVYRKSSSWTSFSRVTKGLTTKSLTSLRLLKMRTSKESVSDRGDGSPNSWGERKLGGPNESLENESDEGHPIQGNMRSV